MNKYDGRRQENSLWQEWKIELTREYVTEILFSVCGCSIYSKTMESFTTKMDELHHLILTKEL